MMRLKGHLRTRFRSGQAPFQRTFIEIVDALDVLASAIRKGYRRQFSSAW